MPKSPVGHPDDSNTESGCRSALAVSTAIQLSSANHSITREINDSGVRVASPIDRLPVELLSMVFLACISPFFMWEHTSTEQFMPLVLSHVCQRWMQCACSTSWLWRTLGVWYPDNTQSGTSLSRPKLMGLSLLMQEYASRAGDLPLCLSFTVDCDPSEEVEACLQILKELVPRCVSLTLRVRKATWDKVFNAPVRLPLLQKICYHQVPGASLVPFSLELVTAPQLKELALWSRHQHAPLVLGSLWSRLTSLQLTYVEFGPTLLETLQQCTLLSVLHLGIQSITGGSISSVSLPNLKILSLRSDHRVHPVLLALPRILAPNVRNVSLSEPAGNARVWAASLASIWVDSGHRLELLDLDNGSVLYNTRGFSALLKAVPSLQLLRIQGVYGHECSLDNILHCFISTEAEGHTFPVPQLRSLHLRLTICRTTGLPSNKSVCTVLNQRRLVDESRSPLCTRLNDASIVILDNQNRESAWRVVDGGEITMEVESAHNNIVA